MSNIPPAPEPNGSQPSYQPPAQGSTPSSSTPASASHEYSQPAGYAAAPPAAYAADSGEKPKGSNRLGLIAFIASLAAVIIGSILLYLGGQTLGTLVEYTGTSGNVPAENLPPEANSAAAAGGLQTLLGGAILAVLALWGFIQGIVAAVKNRGRGWGIAAIILAVLGAVIGAVIWGAGFAAGAGPFLNG